VPWLSTLVFWHTLSVGTGNEDSREDRSLPPITAPAVGPRAAESSAAGREIGGRAGPEPTRYGDWELKGRCIDF